MLTSWTQNLLFFIERISVNPYLVQRLRPSTDHRFFDDSVVRDLAAGKTLAPLHRACRSEVARRVWLPASERPSAAVTAEPPNGGLAAWSGVFASFLLFITTWGFSTTLSAFQSYYQSDLLSTSSPSRIAWVGTIQAFFLISTGVITGPLFDRGYLHHLMIAGCFLTTLGLMLLSLSTEYYQVFLSQGVCYGVGSGLIYVPALSLVSTRFTTRGGIAVGLVTSGASIGTLD
ncbi:MFS monocarboxylate transporter [Aspergillus bombycis]|uniref:MFS monocarboxylate transporter n=1 Tax=Aspergillus bombycis TaxID=109264 RepID=A0A1F8A706_9EURO|nr:MFS monocarboxylate transporter [Aspergillus bombycis]OGM47169.1 MFS monocarboxylate transporter [Aspergillus bombycis]